MDKQRERSVVFDLLEQENRRAAFNGAAAVKLTRRLPDGCDQQGRYPLHASPAEAATDLGADYDEQFDKADREACWAIARWAAAVALFVCWVFIGFWIAS